LGMSMEYEVRSERDFRRDKTDFRLSTDGQRPTKKMFRLLTPHYRVESVLELTAERLRQWEIAALLLDVDCTLKRYRATAVSAEVAGWLATLRLSGVRCCIVSNGRNHRIERFAALLGLPYVAGAMKPFPLGVWAALRKIGAAPQHAAMVGDQIFADVLAGRLAGVKSILVRPLHPDEEPWYTRVKRVPERWWLRWLKKGDRGEKKGKGKKGKKGDSHQIWVI
jgi:HAD superfamily phosphatase (TIGR01668 family)